MRILPLAAAGLCVLVGFCIPTDLSRPVEINTIKAKHVGQVEPLQAPKLPEATQVQLIAVEAPKQAPVASKAYVGGGSKESWMAAAGIPKSEWWAVDYIVSREAGWNPCAYNPGKSDCSANPTSACGLAQSLPCGKQSKYGHWTDPVANLKWQYEYVVDRYGSYAGAVSYWKAHHNY